MDGWMDGWMDRRSFSPQEGCVFLPMPILPLGVLFKIVSTNLNGDWIAVETLSRRSSILEDLALPWRGDCQAEGRGAHRWMNGLYTAVVIF